MTIFDNPFQNAASKYKAQFLTNPAPSKPIHLAPPIDYLDGTTDEYVLVNGNRISVEKYNSVWHPPKLPTHPKGYKGSNPDKNKVV